MPLLDRVTSFHGRLSDSKIVWWPFLFLKPANSKELIGVSKMAQMTVCFAAWLLVGWILRESLLGRIGSIRFEDILRIYLILIVAFALWFNLVTRPLWNRRARANAAGGTKQSDSSCET